MVDRLLEADQVRLFIRNLQPTYRKHLRFTHFENFTTSRNVGMLVEEELAREAPTKAGNNLKSNNQNKDKKTSGSTRKEVHALNHYTEYTLIGATYTWALERLLARGKIDLPKV